MIAACQIRRLSAGQWLYGAQDDVGGPFAVLDGALAMEIPSSSGVTELAWVIQPGHWAGAASALGDRPRLVSIRALVDSEVATLSAPAARRIAAGYPETWRWFGQMATRNGDRAVMLAVALMIPDKVVRVTTVLRQLAESGFVDAPPVPIPLTQSELARICGLSRGPFSLLLEQLERKGIICRGYRRVDVLDCPKG